MAAAPHGVYMAGRQSGREPGPERTRRYRHFHEIDWERFVPVQRATLCFVVRRGEILLIHKKRGIGAGKVNGPGGRIDPGETPRECAVREVQEELRVTPTGLAACGELAFQFADGFSIHCSVFTAGDCCGEPQETDEAVPLWTPVGAIPYDRMWEDDRLWIPLMLDGRRFGGRFLFEGDSMRGHELWTLDRGGQPGSPATGD